MVGIVIFGAAAASASAASIVRQGKNRLASASDTPGGIPGGGDINGTIVGADIAATNFAVSAAFPKSPLTGVMGFGHDSTGKIA